jgi:hypothetical protein
LKELFLDGRVILLIVIPIGRSKSKNLLFGILNLLKNTPVPFFLPIEIKQILPLNHGVAVLPVHHHGSTTSGEKLPLLIANHQQQGLPCTSTNLNHHDSNDNLATNNDSIQ